ncbi:hypothetical protein BALOs_1160 [Halobacteriovorax sp. BALOs_7]|uniref:hypothetical protein n=1 Tax=Halobacteriovorax sp. BALOs_7 TaxID=2109558 RepID=UPI000EA18D6F|nr:hypothetical protein [Halobacteriovorax sp. BALOs_7]AYF44167.1 hypothetical protein BALOs_1160 [Halobacteriovorax sp. BALOs_7]
MSYESNIEMLKLALDLLEELSDEVVFVGGTTTSLYVDEEISDDIRPTEDVDCVIEIVNKSDYKGFEEKLFKKGFKNDTRKDAPLCRYVYGELLTLDVMPANEEVLGFTNEWYLKGIENKVTLDLESYKISIFSLPYFLASKVCAFKARGLDDPRLSWDLEDITLVIDGIINFHLDLSKEDSNLQQYLSNFAKETKKEATIIEAIESFLANDPKRIERIVERFDSML